MYNKKLLIDSLKKLGSAKPPVKKKDVVVGSNNPTQALSMKKGGSTIDKKLSVKKSKIQGKGLFIEQPVKQGEIIGLAHLNNQATPIVGKYHNHSEDNPTAVNVSQGNKRYLVAARDLPAGTEITTNYRLQPDLEQPEDFEEGGEMTPQKDGYRTYSPFQNLPYIDVESDTIDTDNIITNLQLVGNNGVIKNVQKNSGLHKIPGATVIREIPIEKKGGSTRFVGPGAEYYFPGADYVDEYPMMQNGGQRPILYVDPNDPAGRARYEAYQDSLNLHNLHKGHIESLRNTPNTLSGFDSWFDGVYNPVFLESQRLKNRLYDLNNEFPDPEDTYQHPSATIAGGSRSAREYKEPVQPVKYGPNLNTDLAAWLKTQGAPASYADRKKLYEQATGQTDYKGTAEQNIGLLNLVKERGLDYKIDNLEKVPSNTSDETAFIKSLSKMPEYSEESTEAPITPLPVKEEPTVIRRQVPKTVWKQLPNGTWYPVTRAGNNASVEDTGVDIGGRTLKYDGGSINLELTDKEIKWYQKGGYVVEELPRFQIAGQKRLTPQEFFAAQRAQGRGTPQLFNFDSEPEYVGYNGPQPAVAESTSRANNNYVPTQKETQEVIDYSNYLGQFAKSIQQKTGKSSAEAWKDAEALIQLQSQPQATISQLDTKGKDKNLVFLDNAGDAKTVGDYANIAWGAITNPIDAATAFMSPGGFGRNFYVNQGKVEDLMRDGLIDYDKVQSNPMMNVVSMIPYVIPGLGQAAAMKDLYEGASAMYRNPTAENAAWLGLDYIGARMGVSPASNRLLRMQTKKALGNVADYVRPRAGLPGRTIPSSSINTFTPQQKQNAAILSEWLHDRRMSAEQLRNFSEGSAEWNNLLTDYVNVTGNTNAMREFLAGTGPLPSRYNIPSTSTAETINSLRPESSLVNIDYGILKGKKKGPLKTVKNALTSLDKNLGAFLEKKFGNIKDPISIKDIENEVNTLLEKGVGVKKGDFKIKLAANVNGDTDILLDIKDYLKKNKEQLEKTLPDADMDEYLEMFPDGYVKSGTINIPKTATSAVESRTFSDMVRGKEKNIYLHSGQTKISKPGLRKVGEFPFENWDSRIKNNILNNLGISGEYNKAINQALKNRGYGLYSGGTGHYEQGAKRYVRELLNNRVDVINPQSEGSKKFLELMEDPETLKLIQDALKDKDKMLPGDVQSAIQSAIFKYKKKGGSIDVELTDKEIKWYQKRGYIVEELPKAQVGLNKRLTPQELIAAQRAQELQNKQAQYFRNNPVSPTDEFGNKLKVQGINAPIPTSMVDAEGMIQRKEIIPESLASTRVKKAEQYNDLFQIIDRPKQQEIVSEKDLIITEKHKELFKDSYKARANVCSVDKKGNSAGCLNRANNYFDKFVAPQIGSPTTWQLKENLGISSGDSHPRYEEYGESADSWDLPGLLAEKDSKVHYKAPLNNTKEYEKTIHLDPEKRSKFWKDLDLPLGTYVFMGDQGGTGDKYEDKAYNSKAGLVNSNHSAIVGAYDEEGHPILYDYNGLVTTKSKFWTLGSPNVTSIITPKGTKEVRFADVKKKKKQETEGAKALRIELPDKRKTYYDETEMKPFIYALEAQKSNLAGILGVTSDEYDELAKIAVATALTETGGGNDATIRFMYGQPILSYLTDKVGIGESKGLTQLNDNVVDNLFKNKETAIKLKQAGIKEGEYDPWNGHHQAVITMLLLKENEKVIKNKLKNNPGNNANLPMAALHYYQWNNPGALSRGEAQGDNINVKRFYSHYKTINNNPNPQTKVQAMISGHYNRSKQQGGSIYAELTPDEIEWYMSQGYNVEEL